MIKSIRNDYDENTYIIARQHIAYVIDPGSDVDAIIKVLETEKLKLMGVLLTHTHFDHIIGLEALLSVYPVDVYVHQDEKKGLFNATHNLSSYTQKPFALPKSLSVRTLKDGDQLPLGNTSVKVIETPGHAKGGVTYHFKGALFTGDLLFKETIGRTDLPGSNLNILMQSIKRLLSDFKGTTLIYPGHGASSTLGHEKKYNSFIKSA